MIKKNNIIKKKYYNNIKACLDYKIMNQMK